MIDADANWRLAPSVCKERIGEDMILLDTAAGQYFELNESGARMVELIDELGSNKAVLAVLSQEYAADASRLESELHILINRLQSQKLLIPSSTTSS